MVCRYRNFIYRCALQCELMYLNIVIKWYSYTVMLLIMSQSSQYHGINDSEFLFCSVFVLCLCKFYLMPDNLTCPRCCLKCHHFSPLKLIAISAKIFIAVFWWLAVSDTVSTAKDMKRFWRDWKNEKRTSLVRN